MKSPNMGMITSRILSKKLAEVRAEWGASANIVMLVPPFFCDEILSEMPSEFTVRRTVDDDRKKAKDFKSMLAPEIARHLGIVESGVFECVALEEHRYLSRILFIDQRSDRCCQFDYREARRAIREASK